MPNTLILLNDSQTEDWAKKQSTLIQSALRLQLDKLRQGDPVLIDPEASTWLSIFDQKRPFWSGARTCSALPGGSYTMRMDTPDEVVQNEPSTEFIHGWYYAHYKLGKEEPSTERPQLDLDKTSEAKTMSHAASLARALIDDPPNVITPEYLSQTIVELAGVHGADVRVWGKADNLEQEFPLLNTVGGPSPNAPTMTVLNWEHENPNAHIALIGKGVTFDTGGLHLKTPAGMRLMRKDMSGAAVAIALAKWIMSANMPVKLTLVIPAAENTIGHNAFRPSDVLASRSGKTIEIDDPDAEGRLILADAISLSADYKPDYLIDLATLTGAQRMACGFDLPSFFSNDEHIADFLQRRSFEIDDPMWRLPLFEPYRSRLQTPHADLVHAGSQPQGEAIAAALFLREFLPADCKWVHIDFMAWNTEARPGRPIGAEPQTLRALSELVREIAG